MDRSVMLQKKNELMREILILEGIRTKYLNKEEKSRLFNELKKKRFQYNCYLAMTNAEDGKVYYR
jgi:hypothetical protein